MIPCSKILSKKINVNFQLNSNKQQGCNTVLDEMAEITPGNLVTLNISYTFVLQILS